MGNSYRRKLNVVAFLLVVVLLCGGTMTISGCSNQTATETKVLNFSSNYEIDATLDPYNNSLEYTAQVQITNTGKDSTNELYFHLYGNRYKTENEGVVVISVTDSNYTPIKFEMKDDDQLILLTLDDPLDDEAIVFFSCKATIPEMESVYGVALDGEIQMSFFYPQLVMYDKNGWNTKPLAHDADGRYLVMSDFAMTIHAPSEYEVVCNGIELSRVARNGQTTYVFHANQRRELIFIAYTDYIRLERSVGDTKILGYFNDSYNPSHMEIAMDDAAFSMEFFNGVYMEYPYETLIVTNKAWTRSIGSMEYSGLFTVAFTAVVEVDGTEEFGSTDTVFHEMAHQWFYFIVGNNEYQEPWLDEAFATFSTVLCVEAAGQEEQSEIWWELYKTISDSTGGAVNVAYDEPDIIVSNLFYYKGAFFLKELMDAVGKNEFLSILSEYCVKFAYSIATTDDFLNVVQERTTVDVESIIDKYIVSSS